MLQFPMKFVLYGKDYSFVNTGNHYRSKLGLFSNKLVVGFRRILNKHCKRIGVINVTISCTFKVLQVSRIQNQDLINSFNITLLSVIL